VISVVVLHSCDLFCDVAFVRFVLRRRLRAISDKESCPETVKVKSITLTFDRQISEAVFGELSVLFDFWFGEGTRAPCILVLPPFLLDVFFFSDSLTF
jgi:hypothetical protein